MKLFPTKFVCLLAVLTMVWSTPLPAQTPSTLPPLEVSPAVIPPDGNVTVSLPASFPMNNTRWRVGIWEHARPAFLGDVVRDFTVRDGGLRATLHVDGDPGVYDLRLLTNDKRGAALSQPVEITIPGIRREPGWWLFNGTPFVRRSQTTPPNAAPAGASLADAPLFIPGLKRDLNAKARDLTRSISTTANGPVMWRTLEIPATGLMLEQLIKPDYDFTALRTRLVGAIQQARARGESNYAGISLLGTPLTLSQLTGAPDAMGKLRQILNEVAPEAALILRMEAISPGYQERIIHTVNACGALVDAVVFVMNGPNTWALKAARRVAEEQPNYDLPIFVQREDYSIAGSVSGHKFVAGGQDERQLLDFWMSGATGFVLHAGDASTPADETPRWEELVLRNSTLFTGSVTLEDVGLLPTPLLDHPVNERTPVLYEVLRAVQRVPLLARSGSKVGASESFVVPLGETITREAIDQMRASATGGVRIYVEGTPDTANAEEAQSLASLLGGTFKRSVPENVGTSDAAPIGPNNTPKPDASKPDASKADNPFFNMRPVAAAMTLEDPWLFGLTRGRQLPVEKRGEVTLIPGTLSGQTKAEKGKDVLVGPRVVARLGDNSPALIINPVGKGEVVWLPHRIPFNALWAAVSGGKTDNEDKNALSPSIRSYYGAIAAYLQPAIVQVRAADATASGIENIRVALRSSSKGTLLVALMNAGGRATEVSATLNARAGVAFDLADEKELPLDTRGNHVTARVTIPANGYKIIALASTRKDLDEERNVKRLTARLR